MMKTTGRVKKIQFARNYCGSKKYVYVKGEVLHNVYSFDIIIYSIRPCVNGLFRSASIRTGHGMGKNGRQCCHWSVVDGIKLFENVLNFSF